MKEATPSEASVTAIAAAPTTNTTPSLATPVATPIKTVNRKSRVPVLNETDNSDLEGTPNPTKKTSHHPPNHSTTNTPSSNDTEQLETNDRISKEKQKFFRTSAFNAEKKKEKEKKELTSKKSNTKDKVSKENYENRTNTKVEKSTYRKVESERRTRSNDTPVSKRLITKAKNGKVNTEINKKPQQNTRSQQKSNASKTAQVAKNKAVPVMRPEPIEEEESFSEETTSDSSCSSDSESDSSVDNSDSKASIRNIKIPQIFNVTGEKKEPTFGSISGISVDKDAPWGFAAAAAEAKSKSSSNKVKSSENLFISVMKEEGLLKDITDTNSSQDDEKTTSELDKNQKVTPGYGQLRGLYDGLSHLFATPTESRASRSQPNYNPNRRKPKDLKDEDTKEVIKDEKDERIVKAEKVERVKIAPLKVEKEKVETKFQPKSTTISTPNIPKIKNTISYIPNSPKPIVPKDEVVSMTPSGLVKTAVNSKQHERRKLIKSEGNDAQQKCNNDANEARIMKKRNHVTTGQVAATNQPMSATLPFTTNNQTGKIGYPHLPLHNNYYRFPFTHLFYPLCYFDFLYTSYPFPHVLEMFCLKLNSLDINIYTELISSKY